MNQGSPTGRVYFSHLQLSTAEFRIKEKRQLLLLRSFATPQNKT